MNNGTLVVAVNSDAHYDVLYLAGENMIVVLNEHATAYDCQMAVNLFMKLQNQREQQEQKRD